MYRICMLKATTSNPTPGYLSWRNENAYFCKNLCINISDSFICYSPKPKSISVCVCVCVCMRVCTCTHVCMLGLEGKRDWIRVIVWTNQECYFSLTITFCKSNLSSISRNIKRYPHLIALWRFIENFLRIIQ